MIRLTKNFTVDEVMHSNTAIAQGIPNVIDHQSGIRACHHGINFMEPARTQWGKRPTPVESWFRGYALNDYIGGSVNSAHMRGLATDIDMFKPWHMDKYGGEIHLMFEAILNTNIPFDKAILEFRNGSDWMHFQSADIGKKPRRVIYRAKPDHTGEMQYTPYTSNT